MVKLRGFPDVCLFCVAAIGVCVFRCAGFGLRTFCIFGGTPAMRKIKINEKGQITIPKKIRDKYRLVAGTELQIDVVDKCIVIKPAVFCYRCGKALPEELRGVDVCPDCPPLKVVKIY